jgi:Ubiquitin carboxyl-terminal hydrolase
MQSQPEQIGQSTSSEASQHVQIETLPAILVLHLKRFLYDAAADGIIKISKTVHFTPELEVSLGTISSLLFPIPAKAKNPLRLDRSRYYGTRFREICGAGALQALWCTLLPR